MPENQTIAFIDIETTGLSPQWSELTVVGIYRCNHAQSKIYQLVGADITAAGIQRILEGVDTVYTYNGSRFDLPFIKAKLNLDIPGACRHIDLMHACWKKNLYGGLKSVERQCGIGRTTSINGLDAVYLWYEYKNKGSQKALDKLLEYNKEDIVNLDALRQYLFGQS